MKFLIPVLLLIVSCLPGCVQFTRPAQLEEPPNVLQASLNSTVAILDKGRPFCAGAVVRDDIVLTAAHCVDGVDEVNVGFYGDVRGRMWGPLDEYAFTVVHYDDVQDIAVLRPATLELPEHGRMRLSGSLPVQGNRVVAIGHPYGLTYSVSTGIVSYAYRNNESQKWMQVSSPLAPGNSGGPIMNYWGELNGIASFRYEAHLSGVVPLQVIRTVVETQN